MYDRRTMTIPRRHTVTRSNVIWAAYVRGSGMSRAQVVPLHVCWAAHVCACRRNTQDRAADRMHPISLSTTGTGEMIYRLDEIVTTTSAPPMRPGRRKMRSREHMRTTLLTNFSWSACRWRVCSQNGLTLNKRRVLFCFVSKIKQNHRLEETFGHQRQTVTTSHSPRAIAERNF